MKKFIGIIAVLGAAVLINGCSKCSQQPAEPPPVVDAPPAAPAEMTPPAEPPAAPVTDEAAPAEGGGATAPSGH